MQTHAVAISGEHVGEEGSPETLRTHLSVLRRADVLQAAAKIALYLEKSGGDPFGQGQIDLINALFPARTAASLLAMLTAGGDAGGFDVMFSPGQLMTMQKLAMAVGEAGPPTSFDNGALVGHFVASAAQVNDVRDSFPSTLGETNLDLAIYCFRAGELNRVRDPKLVAGRTYHLWLQPSLPWPVGLEGPEDYCQRTFGVSLRRFVAVASAPAIARLSVDLTQPGDVPFEPSTYFRESAVPNEVAQALLQGLTYTGPVGPNALSDEAMYWSLTDLAATPYLPCGGSLIVPCSIRFGLERATTGIFWMLHQALAGNVGTLTEHFGRMFEGYCLRVAKGLEAAWRTVSGEIEYGPRSSRIKSSDILITAATGTQRARIFVECRAGRPGNTVFTSGSKTVFENYIADIIGKLQQLDRSIRDHIAGRFVIPGDLAGPDDNYFPLLVLDEPVHWSFPFKEIIDRKVQQKHLFQDSRVALPVICDIGDFDAWISLGERGHDVVSLLKSHLLADRMEPFAVYLRDEEGWLQPSIYCVEGWSQFTEFVMGELFP